MKDKGILNHIKELVDEEQGLFSKETHTEEDSKRLNELQVELDQYWDLLRQRRALREFGDNPEKAKLRKPGTVENYEQ